MSKEQYSVVYRIMHWAIAICMILLLGTIFLRLNWMNREHVADILQNNLPATDPQLSRDELVSLAKKIRKPMWDWHIYLGYTLTGLFSLRLLLPFLGQMKIRSPFHAALSIKEKFQYWVYIIFYACVTVSLTTGLLIVNGPKDLKEPMEEIHELSIYYLLGYIFLHMGGVFMAEFGDQKGIISRVISGGGK